MVYGHCLRVVRTSLLQKRVLYQFDETLHYCCGLALPHLLLALPSFLFSDIAQRENGKLDCAKHIILICNQSFSMSDNLPQ